MMARVCDSCQAVIDQDTYIELAMRVLDPGEDFDQNEIQQAQGDYCDNCVVDGKATKQLLSVLKRAPRPSPDQP